MPISNPNQLVEEFKKSGEFDRLRRELLAEFQKGEGLPSFKRKLEDIGRETIRTKRAAEIDALYLEKDKKLKLRDDLVQDIKRFPVVERAVADMQMFSDSIFLDGIRSSALKILRKDRGEIVESIQDAKSAITQTVQEVDESVTGKDTHNVETAKDTVEVKVKTSPIPTPTLPVNNPSSSSSTHSGSESAAISPINPTASTSAPVYNTGEQNLHVPDIPKSESAHASDSTRIPMLPEPDTKPSHFPSVAPPPVQASIVSHSGFPASASSSSQSAIEGEEASMGIITMPSSSSSLPPVPVKTEFDSPMDVIKG
ncbi:hypothetical protein D9758_001374 [Tetrapyrgos nigripes]|uniref:BOD1/SHG1 domain-containing protein n=1 Tax=Tetrapyrgos nigripes TaxID=182062 RepID=A0A8H5ER52_9AGAR|nr:hypothetical protein D9758_019012 [Tetrapyrgos nigripes]KAF5344061.1 hypothetical protein D9758_008913 [Tetrapyrgos nigripes]KAF5348016.1 hypothetical protein D9758_010079 [Tetrapyrgos nigripes]KAF5369792.1 hypothetical protein D9758_001374 [Tetrapyrgos nigripes]